MSITRNCRKHTSMMLASVALAFGLATAAPAGAQDIEVGVGQEATATVLPGDPISIPILVDMSQASGQNLASLELTVTWDDTRLTYNSATTGDFGSVTLNESNTATGELVANLFSAEGTTSDFTVLTLEMTAQTTEGVTTVSVAVGAAGDETGNDISSFVNPRDLNLCIGETGLLGDVNIDDAVNIIDAQQIARRSAGLSVANEERMDSHGDVTEDNNINIIDAQQTARFGVGLSTSTRAGDPIPGGCNFAPAVQISSPNDGSTFSVGQQVNFQGSAEDTEDGALTGPALVWTSSIDGQIGTGESFSSTSLSEGNHTITLDATDSDTNVGSASVDITVASGSLEVISSTVGEDIDSNGYTVTVDGGSGQALAVNDTTTFSNLTAGDHEVQLTDVAANCTVFGGNPRTITVPQGGTATTTFEVDCDASIGDLDVVTNTTGTDLDPDGYTATLDGQLNQPAPTNGTITFSNTSSGDHQVELTGVQSNCTVTSNNPQTVSVPSNGTGTATFDVTCDPLPGDLDVTTTTTGNDIDPDGYMVVVDGSGGQAIGVNETITIPDLSAADHTVELQGVAQNCTVADSNPRTVTVPSKGTTSTTFEVSCTAKKGDLEITTVTDGFDIDSDGYTVSVDGGAGQAIGVNNTITIADVPAGDRQVELSGVADNCTIDGSNPRTVTITDGNTTQTTYQVDCVPNIGDIEVRSSTSGSDLDSDGYTATLDGSLNQALGVNDTITFSNVDGGDHQLAISGLTDNCSLSGSNPRTVSVEAGNTTIVDVTVTCEPRIGDLEVTTATSGTDLDPDGYTVSVDGGAGEAIGINNTITISDLPAGDHQVTLNGVAGNCSVTDGNPKTVTIPVQGTAQASFAVECDPLPGEIDVITSTSGTDLDTNGYSVSVDGGAGQAIGRNDTISVTDVPAGDRSVEITDVAPNCTVNSSNPQTVTVPSGGSVEASFDVTCDPLPGDLDVVTSTTGTDLDSDGYLVSLDGGAGQAIGTNGTLAFNDLAAGDHTVELSEVAANCSVADSNPRTVTVPNGGATQTTFDVSCSEPAGDIEVSASTTGSNIDPNGYTVTLNSTQSQSLSVNGSVVFSNLAEGDHTVELTGVEDNCAVSGSNPRTINVAIGQTAQTTFSVSCAVPLSGKIAFDTERDGNREIYLMNTDGTSPVRLTNEPAEDANPAISPGGTRIAFRSRRSGSNGLWVMNSDGSGTVQVDGNSALQPSWSPAGDRLVYRGGSGDGIDLFTVGIDGSNRVNLTNTTGVQEGMPDWSPDGSKIVFRSNADGNFDIYVMNVDGTGLQQVTHTAAPVFHGQPAWSPDGSKIVFDSNRDDEDGEDIYVMDADGSNVVRLTTDAALDIGPRWSRDGSQITFASDRIGNLEIFVMNADGSNLIRLTADAEIDLNPDFSP